MENKTAKEASDDATRESLIAISYPLPDNQPSVNDPRTLSETAKGDEQDAYRNELISISYPDSSPDKEIQPAGELIEAIFSKRPNDGSSWKPDSVFMWPKYTPFKERKTVDMGLGLVEDFEPVAKLAS